MHAGVYELKVSVCMDKGGCVSVFACTLVECKGGFRDVVNQLGIRIVCVCVCWGIFLFLCVCVYVLCICVSVCVSSNMEAKAKLKKKCDPDNERYSQLCSWGSKGGRGERCRLEKNYDITSKLQKLQK